jgi:hypothetical protein
VGAGFLVVDYRSLSAISAPFWHAAGMTSTLYAALSDRRSSVNSALTASLLALDGRAQNAICLQSTFILSITVADLGTNCLRACLNRLMSSRFVVRRGGQGRVPARGDIC